MVSTKTVVVGLASAVGMMQMAPAPPVILGSILGGVVAGAIGGAATLCSRYCPGPKVRAAAVDIMARDLPPGVSQHALDECTGQLNDQKKKGITVSIVGDQNQDSKSSDITIYRVYITHTNNTAQPSTSATSPLLAWTLPLSSAATRPRPAAPSPSPWVLTSFSTRRSLLRTARPLPRFLVPKCTH